ncbi:MAG: hypothetical protein IJ960_08920 [Oscillospiraceae bacterium]|nr:hypothetical protein [Oscillospiraceae bacterium]
MACLKCGRETRDHEVFCPECQAVMASQKPLKADQRVIIHQRPKKAEPPHPTVKKRTPEEQIARLQAVIRVLLILTLTLFLTTAASVGFIIHHQRTANHGGFTIGQNYSTEAPGNVDHGR